MNNEHGEDILWRVIETILAEVITEREGRMGNLEEAEGRGHKHVTVELFHEFEEVYLHMERMLTSEDSSLSC